MTLRFIAVLGLALAMYGPDVSSADAQQAAQQSERPGDELVVVPGMTPEKAIQNFVDRVATPASRSENQLARWDRLFCASIVGLRASYAQLALDQIGRRAMEIGLDVGEPNCRPNVLIIVSNQPGDVAQGMFDHYARKLGYFYGAKTRGRDALRAFVKSTAPVRWWHINYTVNADGQRAMGGGDSVASIDSPRGKNNVPMVPNRHATRLTRATRQDAAMAFLIVDGKRLDGMDLTAVSDYLAMASLAQLDPDADTSSYPSILNLFGASREARPASMTQWDFAYLKGLYGVTREAVSANNQQNDISEAMNKSLSSSN